MSGVLVSRQAFDDARDNAYPAVGTEHVILDADPCHIASASIAIPLSEVERVAAELLQAKRDWGLFQ